MTAAKADGRTLRRERVTGLIEWSGITLVAVLLFVLFSLLSSQFYSQNNLINIIKQVSIVAVLSIGMSYVFLIGGMDLSAGSNMFLSAVLLAVLLQEDVSAWAAMPIAVAACGITGALNGFIIERLKINCVIVTLGSQLAIRGIALVIIEIYSSWIYVKDPVTKYINTGKPLLGMPTLFFIVIALYGFAYVLLHRTEFGRQVYAVGGNPRASALCGFNNAKIKMLCFTISGVTAGIAGVIAACRLGMVNPSVGSGYEFDAVTAVVLGGMSLKGGNGSVVKTLVGALIVSMIANFMTLYGVDANYKDCVTGLFILVAVLFNRFTQRQGA
ncbi:MAG: ABC transporter permease [Clostridia bacterium]|nr:ABC transporter permease [Clostridia bacterium]